ncbi:MAG TPA: PP0621 family protein [Janthinobacterium sp.]|jgi:uncharacterized protein|nr:PP0621 family protein [Janthinobacterium sp.]
MSRILFWLALVFLVMFAIRSKLRGFQQPKSPAAPVRPARRTELPDAEAMLCCRHCGVYYPSSESVRVDGRDYCSQAHAGLPPLRT